MAAPYRTAPVTLADAPAIARTNMSAFWADPNWRYIWRATPLEAVITQAAIRTPNNLLRDRDLLRHFKAVDPATGELVGYIRWKLPVGWHKDGEGRPAWAEGQVADVGAEERAAVRARAEAAWWFTEIEGDRLDDQLRVIRSRILGTKDYLVLDHFAVQPENQGKGAGLALLRHGIQKAQEMGLDIFVMAFVGGFGIYKRMGFTLLESLVQDATPFGGNDNYVVQFMEYTHEKKGSS